MPPNNKEIPPVDPIHYVKEGVSAMGELLKVAGNNPNAQVAGDNIAQAALTVTKLVNNCLLPIAAVNFAFDKARQYFERTFQSDLSEKLRAIPQEQIVEPKASIAGPILQGLAFTHEEPNLKDMYLNLLAKGMDGRDADAAHPAFVEIVKQLTSEEAGFLKTVLCSHRLLPIVELRVTTDASGWKPLYSNFMNPQDLQLAAATLRIPPLITNWIRLGLIEVTYHYQLTEASTYNWVTQSPEYKEFRAIIERENRAGGNNAALQVERGVLLVTPLGHAFADAVGLRNDLLLADKGS